ncbi:putative indole-diterpene biosynthesis protein PaxU [Aspergillus taichungensis]|uniref:Putative indole-diterpene biosynthesis protein PaxU n=1 Tax=Aspergillus taichungensis TaxID=482145 RepID=A0A2J5HNI1_9EURO|nr:putative indole-diterpene biosynthesis protein PaxU [Aspergillus taichungensis]
MASPSHPLAHFTKLSSSIYLQEPQVLPPPDDAPNDAQNGAPKTIILAFWMNAPARALAKYVAEYRRLAPTARIIFILSSSNDFMLRFTQWAQEARLAPAVKALLASSPSTPEDGENTNTNPPVYIHMFSNGGVFTTIHLLAAYRKATGGTPLRVSSTVIDSAPGEATVTAAVKALSFSLPRTWVLYFFGRFLLRVFFTVGFLMRRISGAPDAVKVARRAINSARLVRGPVASPSSSSSPEGLNTLPRRCYIYSDVDELVDWRDVERHADDAEAKGWKVRREKFLGTDHVAHMRVDPERYWGVVKEYLFTEGVGGG